MNRSPFLESVEAFFNWIERLVNAVFRGVNAVILNSEHSFLNLVTVIIPWLVFLAPASMTWTNTGKHLGFPLWLRWIVAIVVEGLGLVSGSQLLDDIWHNRRRENRAKEKKVNPLISGVATFFYLVITISLNAILDVYGDQDWAKVLARVMLTSMGAVAIAIIAVRGLRNEMRFADKGQIGDSSDTYARYDTYDYRVEIGNVLTVEQKRDLYSMGRANLLNYIKDTYPNIHPDIASRWVRFIERDIREVKEKVG